MQPKPEQFGASYAEAFKDQQVVDAYRYRPPYPDEVFDILAGLIGDEPRTVLDVGAGSGDIARRIADAARRVDAVDFSQHMIELGKRLPKCGSSSFTLDLWEGGRGAACSPLCPDHRGVKHSLDRVGESISALSQYADTQRLPRARLPQDAAYALECRTQEPARPLCNPSRSPAVKCGRSVRGARLFSQAGREKDRSGSFRPDDRRIHRGPPLEKRLHAAGPGAAKGGRF